MTTLTINEMKGLQDHFKSNSLIRKETVQLDIIKIVEKITETINGTLSIQTAMINETRHAVIEILEDHDTVLMSSNSALKIKNFLDAALEMAIIKGEDLDSIALNSISFQGKQITGIF